MITLYDIAAEFGQCLLYGTGFNALSDNIQMPFISHLDNGANNVLIQFVIQNIEDSKY